MKYKIFSRQSIYGPAKIEEVTGYPAAKPFFVAKKDKYWGVYEEKSGLKVGGINKTKAEAIEQADKILNTVKPETLEQAIEIGIKDREEFEKSLEE